MQVGNWDGTVALWRLGDFSQADAASPSQLHGMQLLQHMPVMDGPVRGLAWVPPAVAAATGDHTHRCMFTAVGHSDKIRVWDTRCFTILKVATA